MTPLPPTVTDAELLAFIDQWVGLLEREEYAGAFALTDHDPTTGWTADLLREVIKSYDEADPTQRVTVLGVPTDVWQRKCVDRWAPNPRGVCGEIWYDLNINGRASDLSATFALEMGEAGLVVRLSDVHVM
jgi:hypothetical protein